MGEDAAYFDVRNWLRDEWEIPPDVLDKPGGGKVRIVTWVLWSFGGGTGRGYASVPTLARIVGSSEATVRRALRLACEIGALKVITERPGQTTMYEFPSVAHAKGETKNNPPVVKAPVNPKPPITAEPVDETGLEPPDIPSASSNFEWADWYGKQATLCGFIDGYHSTRKQIVYLLDNSVKREAILAAMGAHKKTRKLAKSWQVLGPLGPTDDEVHRHEVEKREQIKADVRKRLSDAEKARVRKLEEERAAHPERFAMPPEIKAQIAKLRAPAETPTTDPAQVRAILKDTLGEPEERTDEPEDEQWPT